MGYMFSFVLAEFRCRTFQRCPTGHLGRWGAVATLEQLGLSLHGQQGELVGPEGPAEC